MTTPSFRGGVGAFRGGVRAPWPPSLLEVDQKRQNICLRTEREPYSNPTCKGEEGGGSWWWWWWWWWGGGGGGGGGGEGEGAGGREQGAAAGHPVSWLQDTSPIKPAGCRTALQ